MNLVDPSDIATALAPILDKLELRVANAVNDSIQNGLDRIHGAKITVTIDMPRK